MIDLTHWGWPQCSLVCLLMVWAFMDSVRLERVTLSASAEARNYPRVTHVISLTVALIPPVAVLVITCWGGFFS